MRAVIVDDEAPSRMLVAELLSRHPEVEVVAECANGFEAVKAINEHRPDVIFLDVQMPKLDGFEVLELVEGQPAVVFVTAYDQYAMRAFDAHAVDYLLKPFSAERFDTALARVRERTARPDARTLAAEARGPRRLDRIVVKDGTAVKVIAVERLDYVEAQDDYVALHSGGRAYLKQQTIASLEAGLDPGRFVRVHRGYLVNLERVSRIEPYGKDSKVAVLHDGTQVPVSRAGAARLKELIG